MSYNDFIIIIMYLHTGLTLLLSDDRGVFVWLTGDAETQAPIVTSFDQGLAIETLVLTYLLTRFEALLWPRLSVAVCCLCPWWTAEAERFVDMKRFVVYWTVTSEQIDCQSLHWSDYTRRTEESRSSGFSRRVWQSVAYLERTKWAWGYGTSGVPRS